MKKAVLTAASLVLVFSLAGCAQEGGSDSGATTSPNEQEHGEAVSVPDFLYGRIVDITGNRVEVALADLGDLDSGPDEGAVGAGEGGAAVEAATSTVPASGGAEEVAEILEFTDETISFTVPAGTKIYSMGEEIGISKLKKGDTVAVDLDEADESKCVLLEKLA